MPSLPTPTRSPLRLRGRRDQACASGAFSRERRSGSYAEVSRSARVAHRCGGGLRGRRDVDRQQPRTHQHAGGVQGGRRDDGRWSDGEYRDAKQKFDEHQPEHRSCADLIPPTGPTTIEQSRTSSFDYRTYPVQGASYSYQLASGKGSLLDAPELSTRYRKPESLLTKRIGRRFPN